MAKKALYYEAGQTLVDFVELTDAGDRMQFDSAARRWSNAPGYTPTIRPNAIVSGGVVTPAASGSNDVVDVTAINAYLNGVDKTGTNKVAADTDVAITRGATAYMIASIVLTAAGAIEAVEGSDSAGGFSETRGAEGGPPYIAVDAIEIAQVRLTSATAGVITADEIYAIPGVTRETLQSFSIKFSRVEDRIRGYAGVQFSNALPAIHTGDLPAKVYASYYTPSFARLEAARDLEFPAVSGSVTSESFYDQTLAFESTSLGAGSFEFEAGDGVSHPYLGIKEKQTWHVLYPDELNTDVFAECLATPYISGSFPAEGAMMRTVNLVSKQAGDLVIA